MRCMSDYVYLDKGYHSGESEKLYKIIKQNNGLIVSLDEEGGVDFADNSTLLNRYSNKFFSLVDFTFLWGFRQHELIRDNFSNPAKVEVTGHPRFEMLKPEYHYLYREEVDKIKNKYGSFLLVNTNMGFGNNIKGDHFVISNYGERVNKIDQIISFDKEKLSLYICLIKELSKKTKFNIVVRPHPEEDLQIYQKAFCDIKNIMIVRSGSVIPWLLATQQMIHPDCTTAIESFFLGKRSYSFLPKNYPKDLVTKLPISASAVYFDFDKIIDSINKNQLEKMPDNNDLLDGYFSVRNQSFKMIIERLGKIKKISNAKCHKILWRDQLWLLLKSLKSEFIQLEKQKLVSNKLKGFNWKYVSKVNEKINLSKIDQIEIKPKYKNKELYIFSCTK